MTASLPKEERLSGKTTVARLLSEGRWGHCGHIRYCILKRDGDAPNRILVTVPKKIFKRAVRRNLLKRRMREAYRTQKYLLPPKGTDIMFAYSSESIATYDELREDIAGILRKNSNEN